jgi:hypothetical protein
MIITNSSFVDALRVRWVVVSKYLECKILVSSSKFKFKVRKLLLYNELNELIINYEVHLTEPHIYTFLESTFNTGSRIIICCPPRFIKAI